MDDASVDGVPRDVATEVFKHDGDREGDTKLVSIVALNVRPDPKALRAKASARENLTSKRVSRRARGHS